MVAICYETPTEFSRFTVGNGSAIPKGTILQLASPNSVIAVTGSFVPYAGIAWMEKVAGDGTTELTVARNGVFGLACVGSITCGSQVSIYGTDQVMAYATLDEEKGNVVGRSLETANGSTVIKVRLIR